MHHDEMYLDEQYHDKLYAKCETAEIVAPMLKMSKQALYRAVRKGLVPAVKIGHRIRFDLDALEVWLECGGSPWSDKGRNSSSTRL